LRKQKVCIYIFILISQILVSGLYAESFYGSLSDILTIKDEPVKTGLKLEKMIAVKLESPNPLLEGIEIIFEIPRSARQYPNHAALYCYGNISTPLKLKAGKITAKRKFMHVIPSQKRFYFYLPMNKDHNFRKDHESFVNPELLDYETWPLILSLMPIAKGIPGNIRNVTYKVTLNPIFKKKALLDMNVSFNSDDSVRVFLNNKEVDPLSKGILVDPGKLDIKIISRQMGEIRDILDAERGSHKKYEYNVNYKMPELIFDIPEEFIMTLDGNVIDPEGNKMEVKSGIHDLVLTMGQYSLKKSISITPGENFMVSFFMDIVLEKY